MLFELQRTVFNQKQFRDNLGTVDISLVAPYLMALFGSADGGSGVSSLVGVNDAVFSDFALQGGSFEVRLFPESGKINVNCLGKEAPQSINAALLPGGKGQCQQQAERHQLRHEVLRDVFQWQHRDADGQALEPQGRVHRLGWRLQRHFTELQGSDEQEPGRQRLLQVTHCPATRHAAPGGGTSNGACPGTAPTDMHPVHAG